MRISWHRLMGKNVGLKVVYNFLGKDEKNTEKSQLTFALNIIVEKESEFFRTVYPSKNHVTTHPELLIRNN